MSEQLVTPAVLTGPRVHPASPAVLTARCRTWGLTRREAEVVACYVAGMGAKETRELLGISATTLSNHTTHLYAKLALGGMGSRAGLLAWAYRDDLPPRPATDSATRSRAAAPRAAWLPKKEPNVVQVQVHRCPACDERFRARTSYQVYCSRACARQANPWKTPWPSRQPAASAPS